MPDASPLTDRLQELFAGHRLSPAQRRIARYLVACGDEHPAGLVEVCGRGPFLDGSAQSGYGPVEVGAVAALLAAQLQRRDQEVGEGGLVGSFSAFQPRSLAADLTPTRH
ncbi:hypothetical protein [Streptomyces sp. NPDC058424]|uniref:hypothetical protein n=1 Tax=Streptomyces sp. NPDC058424 TaxID=3346491 RepID=UPI003664A696